MLSGSSHVILARRRVGSHTVHTVRPPLLSPSTGSGVVPQRPSARLLHAARCGIKGWLLPVLGAGAQRCALGAEVAAGAGTMEGGCSYGRQLLI